MAQKRMALEPYKAKKCIFHAIRYIVFALQVVEHGRIIDYSAANYYLKEILEYPSSKWEDLKAAFHKPVFCKLRDELFSRARYQELYSRMHTEVEVYSHLFNTRDSIAFLGSDIRVLESTPRQIVADPSSSLKTVQFIREHGLQKLRDSLHVRVLPHSQRPNIIHLLPTVRWTTIISGVSFLLIDSRNLDLLS